MFPSFSILLHKDTKGRGFLMFFTSFLILSDEATKINRIFRDVGSFIWKNMYWELEKTPHHKDIIFRI